MLSQEIVKQEAEFAVEIEKGVVVQISKSFIYHPEVKFTGQGICWLEEKIRKEISV